MSAAVQSTIAAPSRRLLRNWRATRVMVAATLRGELADRWDWMIGILNGITYQVTILLFATVVLVRFPPLAGWTVGEILLIASIRLLAHAVYVIFFGNVYFVPNLLQQERFDTFRVRPMPVFLQLCTHRTPVYRLSDLAVALGSLILCVQLLDLSWTLPRVVGLLLGVLGGALIELALALHIAGLVLRFRGSSAWYFLLDSALTNFGNYPLVILPQIMQAIFTFCVPLGFVAYYPAALILGRSGEVPFSPALVYLSPVVAALWLYSAVLGWRAGLRAHARHG
ncbi:MAG: ABC-2 family transporter protein [Sporichthyaceae bacterium]|nr:ABC-2 family transporter protein [Sporichthyaceae bacterium]